MTKIIKAGVIGDPISHSLSPVIHNYFLKKHQIKGSYQAIKISKDLSEKEFKDEINSIINSGFSGFNVTIPHKEKIYKICDHLSKSAKLTKAVNTVIITKDKKIFGHNSDVDGFINNLKNNSNFQFKEKSAFIIGSGGAARAIVYGLIKNGVKNIVINNRNEDRVKKLISDFSDFLQKENVKIEYMNKNNFEKNLNNCDILINSTSLGMKNQDELQINLEQINGQAIIYDIVYNPLYTKLLDEAKKRNLKIITGIGMLVEQALIGFEAWYGKKVENEKDLTDLLLSNL
jgi:shikimate dehydrogenase